MIIKNFQIIKNRWRMFLAPFLTFFFIIFLFFSVLIPRFKKIMEFKNLIKERKLRLEKVSTKLADLDGLDDVSLKNKSSFLLKAIPPQKNIIFTVSQILNLAKEKQLLLESLDVSPGDISTESGKLKNNDFEAVNFKVKLTGEWEKILEYLKNLEMIFPIINIGQTKINKNEQNSSLEIGLETYYSMIPKALGKIDSPLPRLTKEEENLFSVLENFRSLEGLENSQSVSTDSSVLKEISF